MYTRQLVGNSGGVSQQDMGNGVWTRLGRGRCSCDMQTATVTIVEGINYVQCIACVEFSLMCMQFPFLR